MQLAHRYAAAELIVDGAVTCVDDFEAFSPARFSPSSR
jgi:hypothetical protein